MRCYQYFTGRWIGTLLLLSVFSFFYCSNETKEKTEVLSPEQQEPIIKNLIDSYVQAREARDTARLKEILTADTDQLTSSGNWRYGIEAAVQGMLRSSANNPGKRTITVENIRLLAAGSAIADTRYEIENADGSTRKMWSTFVVRQENRVWKISAIRNMLPAGN